MNKASAISARTGTFISVDPVVKAFLLAALGSLLVQAVSKIDTVDASAIYSGVFDLLSIFTGFLSTFYVFIATKGNKFLEVIRAMRTYFMILTLVRFTIGWSLMVLALSYVMMVWNFGDFLLFTVEHFAVVFWLLNICLIAINFGRCVSHFMQIVETNK